MSHHQCTLRGSLDIKPDTTDEAVGSALAPLLEANGMNFERELVSGAIEILDDRRQLNLSLEFEARGGGYRNDEIEDVVGRLNGLVERFGYLELIDYDTGNADDMITPVFVGETVSARNRARVAYANDQAKRWLESALGANALLRIRDYIASFAPLGVPADGALPSSGLSGQPTSGELNEDMRECLLDVVSHHGDLLQACAFIRDAQTDADNGLYWQHQIKILTRMKAQAERALGRPTGSPEDSNAPQRTN